MCLRRTWQLTLLAIFLITTFPLLAYSALIFPPISVTQQNICIPVSTGLVFSGNVKTPKDSLAYLEAVQLVVKKTTLASDKSKSGTYSIKWRAAEPMSPTRYYISGLLADGKYFDISRGCLEVVEDANAAVKIANVQVKNLKTATASVTCKEKIDAIRLYVVSDDTKELVEPSVSYDDSKKQMLFLTDKLPPDSYQMKVAADCDNYSYVSPTITFTVPHAITISKPTAPLSYDVTADKHTLDLEFAVPSFQSSTIDVKLDDKTVTSLKPSESNTPFTLDLSEVPSGEHTVQAFLNISGLYTPSKELKVTVSNPNYDKKIKDQANEAHRDRLVGLARRHYEGLYNRHGQIARINCLAVSIISGRDTYARFGSMFATSLVASRKSGQESKIVCKNASGEDMNADIYAQESAENARAFAKRYLRSAKPEVDLDAYDLCFVMDTKSTNVAGDSGGAGEAALIVSYFLGKPIHSEVAITGTVSADGTVGEVGGYTEKTLAALTEPGILTIILPNTGDAFVPTLSLPAEFVVSHRVIAVNNMNEVLRQVLVDYDPKANKAQDWLKQALGLFTTGDNVGCANALQKVYELTPEDLSWKFWWQVVLNNLDKAK